MRHQPRTAPSWTRRLIDATADLLSRPSVHRVTGAGFGLIIGAAIGFYLTVTIVVAQARAGYYVYSLDDLAQPRWQLLPTILGVAAGTALGWKGLPLLVSTLGLMIGAAVLSIPVGWVAGGLIWIGDSGSWAGAVLASGLGLLAGALVAWGRHRHRGTQVASNSVWNGTATTTDRTRTE